MNKDDIEEIVDSLDLKPFNYVQTKIRLEEMDAGELLEITIDDGEPIKNVPVKNVPESFTDDGHDIVRTHQIGTESYRLLICKGARQGEG
ncbi:MAG: sulfurtransferase TusA family protein [Candidatus Poribacteria bacterium]|nr:sulfurtransferase TusA family protein [Candidatus Poribacteria bacterium]